jgi:PAS domain S-box-containing protein
VSAGRSLRLELAATLAAVAVVPVAVLSAFFLWTVMGRAREQIGARNAQVALALAGEVNQFLEGQVLHVREALAGFEGAHGAPPAGLHLQLHVSANPALASVLLLNPDARVVAVAPDDPELVGTDLSGQPWVREARATRAITWSSATLSMRTGHPMVTLVVPGADGSAVGYFHLGALERIVERSRASPAGSVAVIDRDGTVIAHRDDRLVRERVNVREVGLVAGALSGREGTREYEWQGQRWLGSAAVVPATGWAILVSEPVEVAFAPLGAFRNLFLGVVAAALGAAVATGLLLARRIVRPLEALAGRTRLVAEGAYAEAGPPEPGAYREVEELSRSFVCMAEAVRAREEALARSERNFRTLVTTPVVGVLRTELTGRILFANEAFARMVGVAAEALPGTSVLRFYAEPSERTAVVREVMAAGAARNQELQILRADGERRVVLANVALEAGTLTSVLLDVTESRKGAAERARLEHQLRHAQKLEAVGRLAGGVAHDFNNLLTAIVSYASLMKEALPDDHPERVNADGILHAAERAAHLTQSLLAYSRKQIMQRRPVDLREVVAAVEKLLRRLLGEDVHVVVRLPAARLGAVVDVGQLDQVLVNLCTNARDAMPAGGTLTIEADRVVLDDATARARGLARGGAYARLRVADSGEGMPPEVLERIFEPFFTTKEQGKGTGLGLAIVHGIVHQHEGVIGVESAPGRGTAFEVLLPAHDEAAAAAGEAPAPQAARGGSETILLAEDEPLVRSVLRRTLERAGYRVIEAEDGEDALRKFRERSGEVALCLLDVVMPRMNGRDAAEAIAALRPGARILLASGYAADVLQTRGLAAGVDLLSKPIAPADLLRRVREALDRPAPPAARA